MKRYIEKVIVPFIDHKREALKLEKTDPALAIFDGFRGQTTPDIQSLLEKHCIIAVLVPANCADKLQPMDVSINKPLKDEMKKRFQVWYADEVQKQLKDVPVDQVKVDLTVAIDLTVTVIKDKCTNWIISSWQALQERPDVAINEFRKAGILDAITSVTKD